MWPTEDLPGLKSSLILFDDDNIKVLILEAYSETFEDYIQHESSSNKELQINIKKRAKEGWESIIQWPPISTRLLRDATAKKYTSFDSVWNEIRVFVLSSLGAECKDKTEWLREKTYYRNILLKNKDVLILKELSSSSLDLFKFIDSFLAGQPVATRPEHNLPEQMHAQFRPTCMPILELDRMLKPYTNDEHAIYHILVLFSSISISATNWVTNQRRLRSLDAVIVEAGRLEDWFANEISNPFSPMLLYVRKHLRDLNLRGTFALLATDAADILVRGHPPTELLWRMHHSLVSSAMKIARRYAGVSSFASLMEETICRLGWEAFLSNDPSPECRYALIDVEDPLRPAESGFHWLGYSEMFIEEQEQVEYVPNEPPLNVYNFATAVIDRSELTGNPCTICMETMDFSSEQKDEMPLRVSCGHEFHQKCLEKMINGVEDFSNLCPNCRKKICERRSRKIKADNVGGHEESDDDSDDYGDEVEDYDDEDEDYDNYDGDYDDHDL